ncbi:Tetratricopeptide repeat protein 8-like protein [Dinothrombium tinctorium]|uniref:Tetratricopeptide repeat protein 8-like protein n=1 Tax=Dinothrombium tinctorium TaxID=1965070 RepID=A0A443QSY4_9ACAR|nr:Tetratricopeptide repeat protein 8-like protein [Dinothrombium tinctorium]
MDPLFKALSLFRRRRYEACANVCSEYLEKNPYDQAFWTLKMRCLSQQVYVDDLEADEEGIAELLMDENTIAQVARPGTSLKTAAVIAAKTPGTSLSIRPVMQTGRPITGMLRPGTHGRPGTMEHALKTPRTAKTARPMTSSSGRFVRLGTASMLSQRDGPFINVARLNIRKYATICGVSKPLFEYILFVENDVRHALDLAAESTQFHQFKDWWWKLSLGKCYYKIGMLRDAENQIRSALKHNECTVDAFLWLGKVYIRMDQPLAALEVYRNGLDKFPGETFLMTYAARIHEALAEMDESIKLYKDVLRHDAINVEAIACIAMNHFYNDQPEIALRYYRRILQMGTCNAELYNNIGLCCYYSQQFDMTITCFERALMYSDSDETTADIWYNLAHIVLGAGDRQLAILCNRLALVSNNEHPEAYNNLGVIEMSKQNLTTSNIQQTKSFFQAAGANGKHLYEPHYNLALIGEKSGHYDFCYQNIKKALELYPTHYSANELFNRIKKLYESV